MIILALIPIAHEDRAHQLAGELEKAVSSGRMAEVDKCASALLGLAQPDSRAGLDEAAWFAINNRIRCAIPDYEAPYLLQSSTYARIVEILPREQTPVMLDLIQSAAGSGSLLLQLPWDKI